jgi:hypothetical protein
MDDGAGRGCLPRDANHRMVSDAAGDTAANVAAAFDHEAIINNFEPAAW